MLCRYCGKIEGHCECVFRSDPDGRVAELADAPASNPGVTRRRGSTPLMPTNLSLRAGEAERGRLQSV